MAPYAPYKKNVRFARSRSPAPRRRSPESRKHPGLFQSDRTDGISNARGSSENMAKSILKKDPRRTDYSDAESDPKGRAYDIVNAALQYGQANNIIEKVGSYFVIKERLTTRRPTPGPEFIRCASCKNLAKYSKERSSVVDLTSHRKHRRDRKNGPPRRRRSTSNTSVVNFCPKCYSRMKAKRS